MLTNHRDSQSSPLAARLLLTLLSLPCAAWGQTSGDLTLVSAYDARGIALGNRPALQLRVDHDTDAGWYAGGFASPIEIDQRDQGQLIAYGGRAQRLTSTLSWDAGVSRTLFLRDSRWNYNELYAGLTLQRASARLFYSPAYYGAAASSYLDLNAAWPLGDHLRLAAHGGMLHAFGEYDKFVAVARNRSDVRLALVAEVRDVSLQAGWQVQSHAYLRGAPRAHGITASASLHF